MGKSKINATKPRLLTNINYKKAIYRKISYFLHFLDADEYLLDVVLVVLSFLLEPPVDE